MEALLETLVQKLQRLSAPKLKAVLTFVEFLTWQDSQPLEPEQPTDEPLYNQALAHPDFEALADQLANDLSSFLNTVPTLSDYAVSRAGIYEDQAKTSRDTSQTASSRSLHYGLSLEDCDSTGSLLRNHPIPAIPAACPWETSPISSHFTAANHRIA
jgi:hypothetical protein